MGRINIILFPLIASTLISCSPQSVSPTIDEHTIIPTITKKVNNVHNLDIDYETGKVFITESGTDYKIVAGSVSGATTAANFISQQLDSATGFTVPIDNEYSLDDWDENQKCLIVGREDIFQKTGLSMPEIDLGYSGYYIKTVGNSVFLQAERKGGYQMGAIALLKALVGYDMISGDTVVFSKDGTIFPKMDIVEKPDFDYRHVSNTLDTITSYGMGYCTDSETFIPINGWSIHNTLDILPVSEYKSQHPNWYMAGEEDICYTANGDKEEYKAMVETVYKTIIPLIDAANDLENMVISQEDNPTLCACRSCMDDYQKYGSKASSQIRFMNDLDDLVQEHLKNTNRTFNLIFLAYHESENAPITRNDDGTYSLIKSEEFPAGLKCHEHVGVEVAPINANYTTAFTDPCNALFSENIVAWSKLTQKMYMYAYETNFYAALFPYNSWSYVFDSFKFYYEQNFVYVFNSGQIFQPEYTAFTHLKNYLDAKGMFDVNTEYNEVVNKFFDYYFMDASEPMRKFYESARMQYNNILKNNIDLTGSIYDSVDKPEYWSFGLLNQYFSYCNQAIELIEKYKDIDNELYERVLKHIKIESIFPRFALATLYEEYYSSDVLYGFRKDIMNDCRELNITNYKEHNSIDEVFRNWGLIV